MPRHLWDGGILMSGWCACHRELFHQERVLELGSGSDRKRSIKGLCMEIWKCGKSCHKQIQSNSCLLACIVAYYIMIHLGIQTWTVGGWSNLCWCTELCIWDFLDSDFQKIMLELLAIGCHSRPCRHWFVTCLNLSFRTALWLTDWQQPGTLFAPRTRKAWSNIKCIVCVELCVGTSWEKIGTGCANKFLSHRLSPLTSTYAHSRGGMVPDVC